MLTVKDIEGILSNVKYRNWNFRLCTAVVSNPELYIEATTVNTDTGKPYTWKSRKWRLSLHMTPTEVVSTCLMAVRYANEHEVREEFTYRGHPIFGPHIDVEILVELCASGFHTDARSTAA